MMPSLFPEGLFRKMYIQVYTSAVNRFIKSRVSQLPSKIPGANLGQLGQICPILSGFLNNYTQDLC